MRAVGVDLGGTNAKLAVVEDGRVVESGQIATRSEDGPDAVLARVAELAPTATGRGGRCAPRWRTRSASRSRSSTTGTRSRWPSRCWARAPAAAR
jgi:hypothetical protein